MGEELNILGKIKTEEDLKKVLEYLDKQGFSVGKSYWELHDRKIENIFNNANILGIKVDDKELINLKRVKDYDEAKKIAENYFSKFNPDDKIIELLNTFYIEPDASANIVSYTYINTKEVIDWVDFRLKYNLKDIFTYDSNGFSNVEYFNFDKKFIKIHYSSNYRREFEQIYNLIFNEKANEIKNSSLEWQNMGKIQIKLFIKGTAQLKGDLTKLKEYYYNYIKDKNKNLVIDYNGKREIFKKEKEN